MNHAQASVCIAITGGWLCTATPTQLPSGWGCVRSSVTATMCGPSVETPSPTSTPTAPPTSTPTPSPSPTLGAISATVADRLAQMAGIGTYYQNCGSGGSFECANPSPAASMIAAAGFRHARSSLNGYFGVGGMAAQIATLCATGIDVTFLEQPYWQPQPPATPAPGFTPWVMPADSPANIASLPAALGACFAGYEAANEPDLHGDPNWIVDEGLYDATYASDLTSGSVVYGSSEAHGEDYGALGNEALAYPRSPFYANVHDYNPATPPELDQGDNGPGSWWFPMRQYATEFAPLQQPSGAMVLTESGYCTNPDLNVEQEVSQSVQAAYVPRLFVMADELGYRRFDLFDLSDVGQNGPQYGYCGLVSATGAAKPAYFTTQTLLSLLGDRGAAFTPSPMDASVTGATSTTKTHAWERSDGSYVLGVWDTRPVWCEPIVSGIDWYGQCSARGPIAQTPYAVSVAWSGSSAILVANDPQTGAQSVAPATNPESISVTALPQYLVVKP